MTKIAVGQYQAIADMYADGKTQAQVAAAFGVSGARICVILKKLGIAAKGMRKLRGPGAAGNYARVIPASSYPALVEQHASGKTLQEIGAEYGVSRERVRQILASLGVSRMDGGGTIKCFKKIGDKVDVARAKAVRQEAYWRAIWDMSLDDYGAHVSEYGSSLVASSPMHKYVRQRGNARKRGIGWNFTFPEWWGVWQESGKWPERGLGKDLYVMARYGDGDVPYSVGTVYICTQSQNAKDSFIVSPAAIRFANNPKRKLGSGIGYTIDKRCSLNPFLAQISGRSLGRYPTAELARAAYLNAANGVFPDPEFRVARGESHSQAKITEADVVAIRVDVRKVREIASQYGITHGTVSQIRNRKSWTHVV